MNTETTTTPEAFAALQDEINKLRITITNLHEQIDKSVAAKHDMIGVIEELFEQDCIHEDKIPEHLTTALRKIGVDDAYLPEREYEVVVYFNVKVRATSMARNAEDALENVSSVFNTTDIEWTLSKAFTGNFDMTDLSVEVHDETVLALFE